MGAEIKLPKEVGHHGPCNIKPKVSFSYFNPWRCIILHFFEEAVITAAMANQILPFVFQNMPIRGKLIRIGGLKSHIPTLTQAGLSTPMAELVASSALMASELKNPHLDADPSVTLQIQAEGEVKALMSRCSWRGNLRAFVKAEEDATFEALTASPSVFAATVDYGRTTKPYQSLVALNGRGVAASMESYFNQSVQLTTLWRPFVAAGGNTVGAIFLQALPHEKQEEFEDDWQRMAFILGTIQTEEIATDALDLTTLAARLFAEDDVRIFEKQSLEFKTPNTRKRMEDALKNLGQKVCAEMLEDGEIEMVCEFSGKKEIFTPEDIKQIFTTPKKA